MRRCADRKNGEKKKTEEMARGGERVRRACGKNAEKGKLGECVGKRYEMEVGRGEKTERKRGKRRGLMLLLVSIQ